MLRNQFHSSQTNLSRLLYKLISRFLSKNRFPQRTVQHIYCISVPPARKLLGELIGLNDSWFRNRGDVEDYDKTITPGLYRINNYGGENNPNIDFGFLLVYEINGYVLQNAYSLWANRTMTRSRTETGNWTEWQSL